MFRRKNDILLKSAFEDCFADLLRFYIQDADVLFDMEKGFAFMNKELLEISPVVENAGGTRYSDLLVKTWLRSGSEEWILVHIEIQGQNDPGFARRMFTYYYRALDRFNVLITAFAIFTGNKNQQRPAFFERHFLGTKLFYQYNSYHILDHTKEQLLQMRNGFALVVLAAQKLLLSGKIPEQELSNERLAVAKAFIESKRYSHQEIRNFISFLKNFIYIGDTAINSNFDEQVNLLTGKISIMGIAEAINFITKEEVTASIVINLIEQLGLTNEQAAKIANTTVEFVQEVRQNRIPK